MAVSGYKGVSRIDQAAKNHHGWYVRVRHDGVTDSRFFNDSKHGGKRKALAAAVAYRDAAEKAIGKPRTDRTILPMTARNTSGVVGVRRRERARRPGSKVSAAPAAYYEACWSPAPGKLSRKLFSVEKLGERDAFLAACAHRRQMERDLLGSELKENWAAAAPTILAMARSASTKKSG